MNVRFIPKDDFSACKGFSVLEVLIVMVMILIVISYTLTSMLAAQKPVLRAKAARQFVNYLEQDRNDSMRRRATEASQMAHVTILNDSFYSVTLDANGDGVLDAPLVVSLAEQHLTINGPFPRTFMFDWLGKAVDFSNSVIHPPVVRFTNRSGTSVVKLSDAGQPSVIQSGSQTGTMR